MFIPKAAFISNEQVILASDIDYLITNSLLLTFNTMAL